MNVHEAKTQLSRLLLKVASGEEIIIARNGEPIARLVQYEPTPKKRILGLDAGRDFYISDDFDDPLDPETFEPEESK